MRTCGSYSCFLFSMWLKSQSLGSYERPLYLNRYRFAIAAIISFPVFSSSAVLFSSSWESSNGALVKSASVKQINSLEKNAVICFIMCLHQHDYVVACLHRHSIPLNFSKTPYFCLRYPFGFAVFTTLHWNFNITFFTFTQAHLLWLSNPS